MVHIGEGIKAHKLATDSATVKNWKRKRAAGMKIAEARKEEQLAKVAAKKEAE
ncbi:MAG TPA: hypothetical protein VHM93_10005 [Candidatus Acidoferrum sp.]|nr:hypothetical protein [Candidatus Acidoferrum sp.]